MNQSYKKSFSLTKSNYAFMFANILIALILFFTFQAFSGSGLGRTIGRMLGTLLIGVIVGYICWLFSFKNNKVGEWGFNLMLLIITGYLCLSYYNLYQIRISVTDYQNAESEFYELVKSDAPTDQIDQAYDQVKQKAYNSLSKQAAHTKGKDREVALIAETYLREFAPIISTWQQSFDDFSERDVLDSSMLKTDPFVYENRKQVIQTLIDKSHAYKELVLTMEDTFRTRLLPLNLPKKKLDVVVKNFIYSPKYNMTELVQTFDSLIDYLDYTMMLLNMLNDNPEKWFSEDNELHINDDDFLQTYNQNIEVLWEKEAKLQKLLGQVFN